MKTFLNAVCILALSALFVGQASAHSATLGFTKSADDTGAVGQGYSTWRMPSACPASVTSTSGFTKLNPTLFTSNSYVDPNLAPGVYCYVVTFTTSSATSGPSGSAAATILPAAPTGVTITGSD